MNKKAPRFRFFEGARMNLRGLSGATEGSFLRAKGTPSGTAYPIAAGYDEFCDCHGRANSGQQLCAGVGRGEHDAPQFATATLLPNGKVLIAGGENASPVIASTELYTP